MFASQRRHQEPRRSRPELTTTRMFSIRRQYPSITIGQRTQTVSDVVVSFKPKVEGNRNLKVRPHLHCLSASAISIISRHAGGNKAGHVSNLYLNGSYELFKGISVYAREQLAEQRLPVLLRYLQEGLSFLGG